MNKALFSRKAVDLGELKRRTGYNSDKITFVVEKVIELTTPLFREFAEDLLQDFELIKENIGHMYVDNDQVWHCILVKEEGSREGILVESEGYEYARYAAYYQEEDFITDKLLDQILTIRQEGKYNMFDIIGVQREAYEKNFYELAVFLEEHKERYAEFIMTGQR